MRYVFFTKMLRRMGIPELVSALRTMGVDGADLAVRPGYPVNPENVRRELPRAARSLREAGLEVPLVSAATDLNDPRHPIVEPLFAACHDAQVPCIKLGYWQYRDGDYRTQVDAARRQIAEFEKIGMRFGVKACLHTHSGAYLGVNAAAMRDLAEGFNPAHLGVYLDPGHLALNGEPLPLAFAMVADHLALVAVKDCRWLVPQGGGRRRAEWVPVGQGYVDWAEMLAVLAKRGYAGPLSFHSEYEGLSEAALIEQTRKDVQHMRALEKQIPAR